MSWEVPINPIDGKPLDIIINQRLKSEKQLQTALLFEIVIELRKLNKAIDSVIGHDETSSYYDFVCTKEVKDI
ncbi:MAG: hypothetical protein KJ556_21020 [Gammaproteobacteria bacterium]|nr:hypothetical protein [Gammaproteobacteria bacterium]